MCTCTSKVCTYKYFDTCHSTYSGFKSYRTQYSVKRKHIASQCKITTKIYQSMLRGFFLESLKLSTRPSQGEREYTSAHCSKVIGKGGGQKVPSSLEQNH